MKLSLHGDWIVYGRIVLQDWRLIAGGTGRIWLLELGVITADTEEFAFESIERANQ